MDDTGLSPLAAMDAALDQPNAACPASTCATIIRNFDPIAERRIEQTLATVG
jgi:hypothetical protein